MKTLYHTFLITLLLITASCRSIEKLVDQGRYDDAIVLATKKLAGKKNKKTKHIKSLEEAFFKVNSYDLHQISRLQDAAESGDGAAWIRMYDYLLQIDSRQNRVLPFLPLVSKENYVGVFDLIDTSPLINTASASAAAYFYKEGKEYLAAAIESGDKGLAREAYASFDRIGVYYEDYKDVKDQLALSYQHGITYILVDMHHLDVDRELGYKLLRYRDNLDGMWTQYHFNPDEKITYDLVGELIVTDVYVSPEQEDVRTFRESKELERWVTETDSSGEIVRDSLGNEVKYKEIETVRATLSEISRSKEASLRARVILSDYHRGEIISSEDFGHQVVFYSDACDVRGDRRALSTDTRKRVDRTLSSFPTDYDMIDEALDEISDDIVRYMKGWRT